MIKIAKFATKMDFLGVVCFSYIIVYAILALRRSFGVMSLLLLLIGVAGLSVDSFISFNVYERWVNKK